jgi:hypothetical protein
MWKEQAARLMATLYFYGSSLISYTYRRLMLCVFECGQRKLIVSSFVSPLSPLLELHAVLIARHKAKSLSEAVLISAEVA